MASQIRTFSMGTRVFENSPKFLNTVKAASKAPLTKSETVARPFGYDSKVTLKSNHVSFFNLFSKKGREVNRRQLDHDIAHSPFYESKSFSNLKGKIFTPPVSYFKQDKSKYFPDMIATAILGKQQQLSLLFEDKVLIVRVYSTVSGENCTKTYLGDYLEKEGYQDFKTKHPRAQIIDLCVPQSRVKGLITLMAAPSLRKSLSEERRDLYFLLPFGTFDADARRVLKCDNSCSGYLYVIDNEGKIRWATSGSSNDEESATLWRAVKGIEKSIDASSAPSSTSAPTDESA